MRQIRVPEDVLLDVFLFVNHANEVQKCQLVAKKWNFIIKNFKKLFPEHLAIIYFDSSKGYLRSEILQKPHPYKNRIEHLYECRRHLTNQGHLEVFGGFPVNCGVKACGKYLCHKSLSACSKCEKKKPIERSSVCLA